MDRITSSLLQEYVTGEELTRLSEATQFEHFTGYLVTSKHYTETFSSYDIATGSGGDSAIDTLAIIVNGSLVTDPIEIKDLESTNGYLDVTLVFNQAERTQGFDSAKFGQFTFGVRDFMSETPTLVQNEAIKKKGEIITEILNRSSKFTKGNPKCHLYYCTSGRWEDDQNLVARLEAERKSIEDLGLFREVTFQPIGASKIQNLYVQSKNAISREIVFSQRTTLPDLPNVEEAYIGFLSGPEYLKLIETEDGDIITSIFYDNIRHWQDWNPVNKEIRETLTNESKRPYFPLFNNGITIIAKDIRATGNRFAIEDYQIVNGCQSSFVLHDSREQISDDTQIPIRLISTTDLEVRNDIIKATNRQTQVSDEQLFALSEFPKKLEVYFSSHQASRKLYFERRSRQYNSVEGIEKVRIINMTTVIRTFSSAFLELPHRATRNYKALVQSLGNDICNVTHRIEMYYSAALIHYRLEYLYRSQYISTTYKVARYHMQMAFRILGMKLTNLPPKNSNEMKRRCESLTELLWDEIEYKKIFDKVVDVIDTASKKNLDRETIRTESFTKKVLEECYSIIN